MLRILLRPFSYLSIQHSDSVHTWINWITPVIFAVVTGMCWLVPPTIEYFGFLKPQPTDIWGSGGLISKIQGFVQNLPGFYTAALAAVATFGGQDMLKVMPGEAPRMRFLVEGKLTNGLELNRRLFLSSMFAYLTVLSFLLTIGAVIGLSVTPSIKSVLIPAAAHFLGALAASIYVLFFVQLLTVTAWGLYYLGEKMHLNDGPTPTTESAPPVPEQDQAKKERAQ